MLSSLLHPMARTAAVLISLAHTVLDTPVPEHPQLKEHHDQTSAADAQ